MNKFLYIYTNNSVFFEGFKNEIITSESDLLEYAKKYINCKNVMIHTKEIKNKTMQKEKNNSDFLHIFKFNINYNLQIKHWCSLSLK